MYHHTDWRNGMDKCLWSDRPSDSFITGWPLGNGRIGAMVCGGIASERLILNESGCWSGSPAEQDRAGAARHLPEIRRLLRAGHYREAQELVHRHFTCEGPGSGHGLGAEVPFGCYQILGDLTATWPELEHATVVDFNRSLHLAPALTEPRLSHGD